METQQAGNIILETKEALAGLKELLKQKDERITELELLASEALKYKTALEEIHEELIEIVVGVRDEAENVL